VPYGHLVVAASALTAGIIPELDVSSLDDTLAFYLDILEFKVLYERREDGFVMLQREAVHLMVQRADGPGRRFRTAPLERPYGRGVNFQIHMSDVDGLYARVLADGRVPVLPMEERWYEADGRSRGHRQFVVADPDGYLMRFFQDLGVRAGTNA
jgi:catechol 2,3-dioxygenase-like lactoylglutathione lyase family enzyme